MKLIQSILAKFLPNKSGMSRTEDKTIHDCKAVSASFIKLEYSKAQDRLIRAEKKYNDFIEQNKDLIISEDRAKNKAMLKNLSYFKWGTVVFSTLVSAVAIQILISSWTLIQVSIWISFIIGFIAVVTLLETAIRLRIYQINEQDSSFANKLSSYLYIVPLLYLPLIDVGIIYLEENSFRMYLMATSLVIAFMLNVIVTGRYRQFALKQDTLNARKLHKKFKNELCSAQDKLGPIELKMKQHVG